MATNTLTLSAADIASFPSGKGHCFTAGKVPLNVFKGADGSLKVAPNSCAHMNQKLAPDVEDASLLKCGMHNAKLDPSTMTYKCVIAPAYPARAKTSRALTHTRERAHRSGPTFLKGMGTKVENGTPQPQFTVAMNADGSATLTPPAGFKAGGGCTVA